MMKTENGHIIPQKGHDQYHKGKRWSNLSQRIVECSSTQKLWKRHISVATPAPYQYSIQLHCLIRWTNPTSHDVIKIYLFFLSSYWSIFYVEYTMLGWRNNWYIVSFMGTFSLLCNWVNSICTVMLLCIPHHARIRKEWPPKLDKVFIYFYHYLSTIFLLITTYIIWAHT